MVPLSIAMADGRTTAAAPDSEGIDKPIDLSGRWTGKRFGYGVRGPDEMDCTGNVCRMIFDIVACDGGWCGIAVGDDKPCGTTGLHLSVDKNAHRPQSFDGTLELAKGSAPYVIKAWYRAGPSAGDSKSKDSAAHLLIVGDTGTELLMMRRSFPLQAGLTRIGDAACTLDKATS
jgi:hypothetical protein